MVKYWLMHKNDKCGSVVFDEEVGRILEYQDNGRGLSPYLGNCDVRKLRKWWEMRAVPASRNVICSMIKKCGLFKCRDVSGEKSCAQYDGYLLDMPGRSNAFLRRCEIF